MGSSRNVVRSALCGMMILAAVRVLPARKTGRDPAAENLLEENARLRRELEELRAAQERNIGDAAAAVPRPPQQQSAGSDGKDRDDDGVCDLSSNLSHVQAKESDYPRQHVFGPMQADEMLTTFSIIRTSFVKRVLEVGGFKGDSAWNFLEALRCKVAEGGDDDNAVAVYTVDLNKVKQWTDHPVSHKTLVKDAATLTMEDVDNKPVDAVLLDCHAFYATQNIVKHIFDMGLLSKDGFIFLHDTGLHPVGGVTSAKDATFNDDPPGLPHQPVERLIAQWIQQKDCSFQRISFHDDSRNPFRHGLTIMQRRLNLDVNHCTKGIYKYADYSPEDCLSIQKESKNLNKNCPVV